MKKSILLLYSLLLLTACRREASPLEKAKSQIDIGMARNRAVDILERDSWYHQVCPYRGVVVHDLFFYGSHRYDYADIIIVLSVQEDGEYEVDSFGSFEPYIWQARYEDCIQQDKFEH
jgi:hypothetical protein